MTSFLRVLKYAFQDMGRNLGLSLMTVFILILMLLSVNTLWGIDILTGQAVQSVKDQINISLYFIPDAEASSVEEIKNYLTSFPEVVDLQTINKEEVLQSFKDRHFGNNEVLGALDELGENPFGSTMVIHTREPEDYKNIMIALDVPEYENLIETKSFEGNEGAVEKLQNITNRIERVGFGLAFLFAIIAFMIIFNTIRVAINTQKTEIGIKRLVGASGWFIRGPFLIESFLFTLISVLITFGLVFLALSYLDPYLAVVLPDGFALTNYYKSNILLLFGAQFISVLILTVLSSIMAMRKQLQI